MAPGASAEGDRPLADAEQIAEALREDPIVLSTILGNGATATLDRELHSKLELAQYPVFVVLTQTPAGLDPISADEELATQLHTELDQDGVYYVSTSAGYGHLAVYGDVDTSIGDDEVSISLARYTALDQVRVEVRERWGEDADLAPAAEAGVVLDIAARSTIPGYSEPVLTDDEVAAYGASQWHSIGFHYVGDPPALSAGTVLGAAVGVVVSVLAFRALGRLGRLGLLRRLGLSGGRPARDQAQPLDAERLSEARRELDELDDELEKPRAREVDREKLVVAQQCRSLAHGLVGAPEAPTAAATDLDVVGALVLTRTALDALRSTSVEPYSCCFVNPLHGRARHRAELPGGLGVPTCSPCRRDLERGSTPKALMEQRGQLERPYYAGDSIWARTGYGSLVDELWTALDHTAAR